MNNYGVEIGGILDHDETAVHVEEIEDNIISIQHRAKLKEILATINPNDSLSEELLVQEYSAARQFVHSCIF